MWFSSEWSANNDVSLLFIHWMYISISPFKRRFSRIYALSDYHSLLEISSSSTSFELSTASITGNEIPRSRCTEGFLTERSHGKEIKKKPEREWKKLYILFKLNGHSLYFGEWVSCVSVLVSSTLLPRRTEGDIWMAPYLRICY